MSVTLYHHPWSRAASVIAMLEEVNADYDLQYVDIQKGEQKSADYLKLNPMGKVPTLLDGDTIITETAAIGMYLADKFAPGRLAPALDDPARGTYYRWICFSPSVIEPSITAKMNQWECKASQVGWGDHEAVLDTMVAAIGDGPWLLGERFTMADLVFGSTMAWLLKFGVLEQRPEFVAYAERLQARPSVQAADAKNAAIIAEHQLGG